MKYDVLFEDFLKYQMIYRVDAKNVEDAEEKTRGIFPKGSKPITIISTTKIKDEE